MAHIRRLRLLVVPLLLVSLALPACGRSSHQGAPPTKTTTTSTVAPATSTTSTSTSTPASTTTTTAARSTTTLAAATSFSVYLVHHDHLAVVHRSVPFTTMPATAAVRSLLAGPTAFERSTGLTSAVPAGTALSRISIAGGTATVTLAGSLTNMLSQAQLVYTLTQFPTVQRVVFANAVGQTRADFEGAAPAVLVDSPAWGEKVSSPLRVRGSADTFEATFRLELTDWDGRIVASQVVMATSGTGTRGTFDATLRYSAARTGLGSLIASYTSPADGTRVVVEEIPLTVSAS